MRSRRNSQFGAAVEFRRETLPPLAALEAEWRGLEPAAAPSFFTSWHWIGTFLTTLPEAKRPDLLRGSFSGETVALALIGAKLVRRHGLIRSRALFLNETGDPDYDVAIEHNGLLVATPISPGRERCLGPMVRRVRRTRGGRTPSQRLEAAIAWQ